MTRVWVVIACLAVIAGTSCDRDLKDLPKPKTYSEFVESQRGKKQTWGSSQMKDPMDDTTVSIVSIANRGLDSEIVIRCKHHKTEAYVNVGSGLEDRPVVVRFDSNPAVTQQWARSDDMDAVFAPNPIDFARRLNGSTRFLIKVDKMTGGAQILEFDVDGLDKELHTVSDACDWKAIDEKQARARKQAAADKAAHDDRIRQWKRKLSTYVGRCEQFRAKGCFQHAGYIGPCEEWCWRDPQGPKVLLRSFPTEDEALTDAAERAEAKEYFRGIQ